MRLKLENTYRLLRAISILFTVGRCLPAYASFGFGCSTQDRLLTFGFNNYEGDGIVPGDVEATWKGRMSKPGLIGWMKWKNGELDFTNFSWSGRKFHVHANEIDPNSSIYKVSSGFIVIDGVEIDLKNFQIQCEAG